MEDRHHREKLERGEDLPRGERVNINTAGREELARLYRIGDDLADEIVRYREAHGPFHRPEDIEQVPGIGPDWYRRDSGGQITV